MIIPFKKQLPSSFAGYIKLVVIWASIGFAAGTLILIGPLRLWINYVRTNNLSPGTESAVVICMIGLLVYFSFTSSLKLFQWQLLSDYTWASTATLFIPIFFALLSLWFFMHPSIMNKGETSENVNAKFAIGPYPTEEKIKELKVQGYTTIVSLLSPSVLPFEPALLKEEETNTVKLNMHLIEAPMLPWVGNNENSLKVITDIVEHGTGKYYFHCYLGKDRVNIVKNLIVNIKGAAGVEDTHTSRTFESQGSFERGEIYKIDSAIYVTPFPTDEELLAFFLAGNVKSVVNIMDSTDSESKSWLRKEVNALNSMKIAFAEMPVAESATDKDIQQLLRMIDSLPRPIVIHHWNTSCTQSVLFRKSYYNKTGIKQINLATKDAATF